MKSLARFWLPFTENRYFKEHPKFLTKAYGMYYEDHQGKKILDSCAGLWCVNAGHNQKAIVDAIQKQCSELDYAPSFNVSHPLPFAVAEKLTSLAPRGFTQAFFASSGSEAVDTSLKIALQYQQAIGTHEKTLLVGREKDYHGVGFGGISIGGLPNNQRHFPLLPNIAHLPHTHSIEKNAFSKGLPQLGAELAGALKTIEDQQGNIAAVIVEPLAGSVGVYLPPEGYLKELRRYCDEVGALLIFDEVITAFGRIGDAFAANRFDVMPDIITLAKGLTNGAIPMGAVLVKEHIYDAIVNHNQGPGIEFFHGYTYTGHPLACAAALATLHVYEEQKLFERSRQLETIWQDKIHQLQDLPHVQDIRNYGLVGAIELRPRENAPGKRAFEIFNQCYERGVLVRITGDTIAFSPPLIIEESHMDDMFNVVSDTLSKLP